MNASLEKRLNLLVSAGLLAWPVLLWALVRHRPPWGDEIHFLETVRLFGRGLSWDLIRSYPEMSAPLTYLVYSVWGHLVGFSTPALRLLAPAIAWGTATLWFFVIRRRIQSPWIALVALGSIVLNPYFVGLSVFVFTDMLSLLGLAMVVFGVDSRRPWVSALGLAIATCARQYLVFLAPALVVAALLGRPRSPRDAWRLSAAAVVGTLPLMLLVVLWGGRLSPANVLRDTYLSGGMRFDPHALALYLAIPAAYLALLVVPIAFKASWRTWSVAALFGAFEWAFPVQASIAQTREGVMTVGFLHQAMVSVMPAAMVTALFSVLAVLTAAALLYCGRRVIADIFLWAAIGSFLVVMPFSYIPWEKYALPLFMLLSLLLGRELDLLFAAPERERQRG